MSNISYRRFPYTRWIDIQNDTAATMYAISLHTEGSGGHRVWRVSGELAPGELQSLSFDRWEVRFRKMWLTFSRTRGGASEQTAAIHTHFNAYFRWLFLSARDGLLASGREQGDPIPAYVTSSYSTEQHRDERAAALVETAGTDAAVAATSSEFFELVNRTGRLIDIFHIEFFTKEGAPVGVDIKASLPPDRTIDLELNLARIHVLGCRIKYRIRGKERSTDVPFQLVGERWFVYGTVSLYETVEGGSGDFQGRPGDSASWDLLQKTQAPPHVEIEADPHPEFPDAYCGAPMRIRNFEAYGVLVRYSETYSVDGPTQHCPPGESSSVQQLSLGPGQARALGCSRYQTPNMWCAERRSWRLLSAVRTWADSGDGPSRMSLKSGSGAASAAGHLFEGGWTTSDQSRVTVITATALARPRMFHLRCTELVDTRLVRFKCVVDGKSMTVPFNEGGGVFLEGKSILIEQLDGGSVAAAVWSVVQEPETPCISSQWLVEPKNNSECLLAVFSEDEEFVVGFNRTSNGCQNGSMTVLIDGKPVSDPSGKALQFLEGSSLIGKGKTVSVIVTGSCSAHSGFQGEIKIPAR